MNRSPATTLVAALIFACAVALAGYRTAVKADTLLGDFRAFYCAASVTIAHDDPYAVAPMAACESQPVAAPLFRTIPPMEVPAPLPGYLIAAFTPLALLPYSVAVLLWVAALAAAGVLSCVLIARLGWCSFSTALIALAVPLFVVSAPVGELPPIALLGVLAAAYGMREKLPWLVGGGVALCAVEPQIALPLAIAIAFIDRRTWLPIACVAVAALAASYAALGWNVNVEYVTTFLPTHIAAEVPRVQQYTIGWALHQLGTSIDLSLVSGRVAYAIVLILSALIGRIYAKRGEAEGACLFVPVLALLGGPFVHVDHLLLAFPAAFWCARQVDSRAVGVFALIALALPIAAIFAYVPLVITVPLVALAVGREYYVGWIAPLRIAATSSVVAVAIAAVCARFGFGFVTPSAVQAAGAQDQWSRYILAGNVATSWTIWLIKAPMWAALLSLTARVYIQLSRRYVR